MNRGRTTRRQVKLLVALAICVSPLAATAQTPVGADTLSQRAASESLAVLRVLDDAVRRNAKDVASWYRRGMVAWALSIRAGLKPSLSGLDGSRLGRTADESLREAVSLDPNNVRARIALGQRLMSSTVTVARIQANNHFDQALETARRSGDRAALSEAAVEVGRVHWRRYDSQAQRVLETDAGLVRSIEEATNTNPITTLSADNPVRVPTENAVNLIHSALIDVIQKLPPDVGMTDYKRAEDLFREAYGAMRTQRAFRQLAMLLAEKSRWTELVTIARERTVQQRADHWGWLVLGLALQRGGEAGAAHAAFDSALARMDPREATRLTGLQRVMHPADTAAYLRSTPEARAASDRTFWLMADPLWSRPGNVPRNEMLARVVYAELRWTLEELGLRGADSDRGNVFIRFGPPDLIAKLGPRTFQDDITVQSRDNVRRPTDLQSELAEVTFWDWNSGILVVFWGTPGFGTARIAGDDRQHVEYQIDKTPSTFTNATEERILAMPSYVARFRGPADSVDLYIAAAPPINEIRAASSTNTAVHAKFWLFGRDVPNAYNDSLVLRTATFARWTYRVPPSNYLYRIEATADAAMVAGSVSAWVAARGDSVTGFATRGFGISDILLGPRATAAPTARRWTDVEISPMLAALPRAATLTVLWENYELGSQGGRARYEVAITITRERSAAGRVTAEILDAIAGTVGIDTRSDDRITMRLEREMAHAPAFVDRVDLGLSTTPPGQYRLELRITDRVSGRTTTRATRLSIRP